MSKLTRKLIAKELHVNRWFIVASAIASVLAICAAPFSETAFNVAALTWLTIIIALGVMMAIYGIMNERKEHSLEFVLSLPLSGREYVLAKLLGLMLSYAISWLVSSGAAVVLVLATPGVPDGLLPYVVLLCVFLLTNFTVVLAGTLHARSEAWVSVVIIVTNMAVSVFMFTVGALPGLKQHMQGQTAVWNDTFFNVLLCEIIVFVIAFTLPLATTARRRDFL
jgi:ABC-type transport system involved in multi-copper enzyme maturation permease subunit